MKNIIVAGAEGFIGSSLVKRLIKEDVSIWTLDKGLKNGILPRSEKIIKIKEIHNIDELKYMFRNIEFDLFYNFAWQGVNGPDKVKYDVQINNIMLTLRYAELAKALKCKKYLCAGTIAERSVDSLHSLTNSSGGMMYSSAKLCSHIMLETYCKNIGLDFVWMQFANIYGPDNKTGNLISYTIDHLKRGEAANFGPARQLYDFLFIDDLIEAIYRLGIMKTDDNFYYIGSARPRILADYLKSIGMLCGKPELIRIGERADDGVRYSYDMMDSSITMNAIGNYISDTFENHIRYTISHY